MATNKYVVTVEQLNRINPVTREAEPLHRGDPIELDPTSADARRWLDGNCIVLVPDQEAAATADATADAGGATEEADTSGADGGQHSAPDDSAGTTAAPDAKASTAKAGKAGPAGSTPSPAPDPDSGQGAPVS